MPSNVKFQDLPTPNIPSRVSVSELPRPSRPSTAESAVSDTDSAKESPKISSLATSGRSSPISIPSEDWSDVETEDEQALERARSLLSKIAFAFDIDGVLLHGGKMIPEAKQTVSLLKGNNPWKMEFPFILLTNGGGKSEQVRAEQVSNILGEQIVHHQLIQSHTPLRQLANQYKTVLIVGGETSRVRHAAEEYGFENVVLSQDILAWKPHTSPWRGPRNSMDLRDARPRLDFETLKFDAILVFTDSRDYASDMQIMIDLLLNDGYLAHANRPTVNPQYASPKGDKQLPVFWSQNDLCFPTEFEGGLRLTVGAFRIAIEAQYKYLTGEDLKSTVFGKPEVPTYQFAERELLNWTHDHLGPDRKIEQIYMVGDNPLSDIKGGNEYGWNTALVRTGVFQGTPESPNDVEHPANFGVFDNVLHAVESAMKATVNPRRLSV